MYNYCDGTLSDFLHSYDAALVLEVKNGASQHARGHAARQVRNGVDYVSQEPTRERLVIGGIFYINHDSVGSLPPNLDFMLSAPNYNGSPQLLMKALFRVLADDGIGTIAQHLLQRMRYHSECNNIPVSSFFNVHEKGYWRRIQHLFPDYRNGRRFLFDTSRARARLAEEYAAALFCDSLSHKSLEVRHHFTHHSRPSDIDVLIGTFTSEFLSCFDKLSTFGIKSEISFDLSDKLVRSHRA